MYGHMELFLPNIIKKIEEFNWGGSFLTTNEPKPLSIRHLSVMAESFPMAVLVAGPDQKIVIANHHTEDLFGYAHSELNGQPIDLLVPESHRPKHTQQVNGFYSWAAHRPMGMGRDVIGRHKNGHEIPMEVGLSPIQLDEGFFVIASCVSLVIRRTLEESLKRSNSELEQFASIASHDLREPLRKVHWFAELLKEECSTQLTESGKDYLTRMQRAVVRMRLLIDGLLEYSRVLHKSPAFEKVDLKDLVAQVENDLEVAIVESGAEITKSDLPLIEGDRMQMKQLFQNLIANSLKYRKPEISPHITITSEILSDSRVEIRVKDNGIGFQEKYSNQIFQSFKRLHNWSEYEGVGMGLAICRKVVDRHQGSIQAIGAPNEGATFVITLPLKQENPS